MSEVFKPHDLAVTNGITIAGGGGTFELTSFMCSVPDASLGAAVESALSDAQAAMIGLPAGTTYYLIANSHNVRIQGGNSIPATIYYMGTPGITFGQSGTLPSTTLMGTSGITGTITVQGGWICM
jgi:hypothetical protein